jgi:hypothetical protein
MIFFWRFALTVAALEPDNPFGENNLGVELRAVPKIWRALLGGIAVGRQQQREQTARGKPPQTGFDEAVD